jgi:hypothetical protein
MKDKGIKHLSFASRMIPAEFIRLQLLLACLSMGLFAAQPKNNSPQVKPATPSERLQALEREYEDAQQEFSRLYQEAKTDAEREKVSAKYPQPENYSGRFLVLAETNPKDPVAVDALVWIVTRGRSGSEFDKALDLLLSEHLQDAKISSVCQSLVYSSSPAAEKALRQIREKSSLSEVRGQATFSLAQYLRHNSQAAEAEKLYAEVIEEFGNVSHYRGNLGGAAKSALFEMRNLVIGKAAPEIEGEDVDAKRFKMSDYRGKVVVLDFWGDW